jgi:hypothetical protein
MITRPGKGIREVFTISALKMGLPSAPVKFKWKDVSSPVPTGFVPASKLSLAALVSRIASI